jgi:hypothetical protein
MPSFHRTSLGVLAALAGLAACDQARSPSSAEQPATACDPLAAVVLPVTLGTVLAVGKDAGGTLYVVEQPANSSSQRLFVSRAMTLARQRVSGSGQEGSGPGSRLLISADDSSGPYHLEVEMGASGAARIGLLRGPIPRTKFFTIGVDGEVLEVRSTRDLDGYRAENLPGTFSIEHAGSVPDGRWVVVTSPDVDTHYEDFRLFFGPPERLVERPVLGVARGSYTTITFTVDGREAKVVFGSQFNTFVSSELVIDGQSQALTAASAKPDGATFFCTK